MTELLIVSVANGALRIWLIFDPDTLVVSAVEWQNSLPNAEVTVKNKTFPIPVGSVTRNLQGKPIRVKQLLDEDGNPDGYVFDQFDVSAKASAA